MEKVAFYKEQLSSLKDVMSRTTQYMDDLQDQLKNTKLELEHKHNEILQSISYASKLQSKIVLDEKMFESCFAESYMYMSQRDGIGGDMLYGKLKNNVMYFGLMDCTGHGIPGALISIMGYTFLEEILNQPLSLKPSEVCSKLDDKILTLLGENKKSDMLKDGMDAIFCSFDLNTKKLTFSCAGRPIWYCASEIWNKIKSKGGSIGGDRRSNFVDEVVYLNEGDEIFLFSDGLTDQFGGSRDKKYLPKRVFRKIQNSKSLSLDARLTSLRDEHLEWKSQTFQTDDVAFLGLKV